MTLETKASRANYGPAPKDSARICNNCRSRQGVPWNWCDKVGRQIMLLHTCKHYCRRDT